MDPMGTVIGYETGVFGQPCQLVSYSFHRIPGSLPNTTFGSLPNTTISGHFQTPFEGRFQTHVSRVTSKHRFRVLGAGTRELGV